MVYAGFAEKELIPLALELDVKEIFPVENLKEMASLGLMAMTVPEEYSGAGMGEEGGVDLC